MVTGVNIFYVQQCRTYTTIVSYICWKIKVNSIYGSDNNNIIICLTMFMVLSSSHSHCESSPGSFDECRLSAGWPPTIRPKEPIWAMSPPKDWLLPSAVTIAIYYYYSARKLILILPSHGGWKAESTEALQ